MDDDACLMVVCPHRGEVDVWVDVVFVAMVEGVWLMVVGVGYMRCFDGFVPPGRIQGKCP